MTGMVGISYAQCLAAEKGHEKQDQADAHQREQESQNHMRVQSEEVHGPEKAKPGPADCCSLPRYLERRKQAGPDSASRLKSGPANGDRTFEQSIHFIRELFYSTSQVEPWGVS